MASCPSTRRHTSLDETLRTLDDAFMATLTPTNTWLDDVQPSSGDDDDDRHGNNSPIEGEHSVHFRHDRCQELPKSKHDRSQTRKISLEPRASSLPPGTRTTFETPSVSEHRVSSSEETSGAAKRTCNAEFAPEVEASLGRANTDP